MQNPVARYSFELAEPSVRFVDCMPVEFELELHFARLVEWVGLVERVEESAVLTAPALVVVKPFE